MTKRQKGILYTVCTLVFIACFFVAYWQFYGRFHQLTNDAYIKGNIIQLGPRISGYVTACDIKDNHFVASGTPLVFLDDRHLKIQLASAEAGLREAKAELESLHARSILDHDKIALTKARLAQNQATLTNEILHLERIKNQKRNYIAQSQLDSAEAAAKAGKAAVAAARAEYHSAMDQVGLTKASQQKAEAAVVMAETRVRHARLDLSHAVLRAPVDGVITNRSVNQGMFVSAGMPLLSLVPLDSLWVVANFKETQLKNLKPGQPVSIRADAYPGKVIKGRVDSIAPGAGSEFALLPPDNATGNFTKVVQRIPVKIAIDHLKQLTKPLYPGLSVRVDVDTKG